MKEKITIYTLAKELGMSPSMVSRAFNPNARIAEDKRNLVLKKAQERGFSPNNMASRLSMKSIKIGVLSKCIFAPVSERLHSGILRAYEKLKDYKIEKKYVFLEDESDFEAEIQKLSDCDGVIVVGLSAPIYLPLLEKLKHAVKNVVQLQSCNEDFDSLFDSKHSEKIASEMAAEFLSDCLRRSESKNVVFFTGNSESAVHKRAKEYFIAGARKGGLNILECIDMKDDSLLLKEKTKEVFEKYRGIDAVYISSGNSVELCDFIKKEKKDVFLVTFDLYEEIEEYIRESVITATICQNLEKQGEAAFEALVNYLVKGEKAEKTIYTDVNLVMKANLI